jgi:hypothetical protein
VGYARGQLTDRLEALRDSQLVFHLTQRTAPPASTMR